MATDSYADLFNEAPAAPKANLNLRFGVEASPDQAAEATQLARRYRLPVGVVSEFREDYKQKAQVDDARAVVDQSPKLRDWLAADANNARISHDDTATLGGIEGIIGSLGRAARYTVSADDGRGLLTDVAGAARSLVAGVPSFNAGVWGAAAYPFEAVGLDSIGGFMRDRQRGQTGMADRVAAVDPNAGLIERGVMSGMRSAGQNIVTLPLGFANATRLTGEQAMLAAMGLVTFGQSYGKARDQGATVGTAGFYGLEDATAEVVTEKFMGAAKLLGDAKAGMGMAKLFMRDIAREIPGEMGATVWQNFNEWATLNPEKTVQEWLAEQPAALAETVVATIVGGGAQVGAIHATQKVMGDGEQQRAQAQQAERSAAAVEQLQTLGAASKLNARDATTFKALVAQIADEEGDAPTEFFIDQATLANSLNQSGVTAAELGAIAPTVASQIEAATGGDIRVPVSEFLLAGEAITAPLIDHLRTSEDAMTRAEATEYLKTQGETIRADVEAELQKRDDSAAFRQSIDGVRTQFETELNNAKRFTPSVNAAYADLLANFYGATASRLGMTPDALLDKYKLRVQSASVAGERTLNQADASLESVREAWSEAGIKHAISEQDGTIEVSQIVVPKDKRGQGIGTEAMQKLLAYADATVQRVVLTPSSDFGGTKSRLEKFYKGLGFVANKRRSKDFTTRATMIREPHKGGALNQSAITPPAAEFTVDENGNPEINSADVRLMFAHPTERFEFIPEPGQQMYNMAIMSPEGEYLGYTEVVYENGKLTGLYDIEVTDGTRSRGTGAKVIEAMLAANPDSSILISNVVPAARGFWEKVGVPQQNVGEGDAYDGQLDWETYAASPAGRKSLQARRDAGSGDSNPRGAEGGSPGALPGVLDQGDGGGVTPRAQIAFPADIAGSPSVISLLAGADLSSFLHESGHFFLEVQSDLATRIQQQIDSGASLTPAERGIVDDMNQLLRWFGIKGNESLTPLAEWSTMTLDEKREHHETFARGFERYTMEGIAPSIALQDVFSRFRSWLVQVYKTLRGLNVDLNDDVRAVMGRMLATDFAIEEAEAQRSMGPLFKDAESAGMTLDEFNAYQATAQGATDKAAAELQTRGMKDMKWLSRAKDKALKARQEEVDGLRRDIRNEVRSEVMAEPVYQAWQFLTGKQQEVIPGAQAVDEIDAVQQSGKLRTQVLRDMYGSEEAAAWRELSARRMTSDTTGMHPEIVAEMFGYDSADAMVKALVDAMPPKEVIDASTDQRMLEMFGDIASPEALQRAADEAVHNEARARFIATEMKALEAANKVREKRGKTSVDVLARAAKEYAQNIIARLKVREIRPNQYAMAEARSAKRAEKAFMAGKTEEAATHKRNQLVNNYATKAAYDAQDEVASAQKYFRKFDKRSKTIDAGYLDQIQGLLSKYDLSANADATQERKTSLRTWVQSRIAEGQMPMISESLLSPAELSAFQAEAESRDENGDLVYEDDEEHLKLLADAIERSAKRSYRDLTMVELRGLRETVEQIEHLGRLKNEILTAQGERNYAVIRDEITKAIIDNAAQSGKNRREPNDWLGKKLQTVRQFGASHIKVATQAQVMDGGAENGPVWRYLVKPANERASFETMRRAEATAELDKIFRPILKKVSISDRALKGRYFESLGTSLNWGERFRLVMNLGTESNLQRLLEGGIVNDKGERIDLTMDRIRPVINSLTAKELHAVQAAWDFHEKMWPEIEAMEKRVSGVAPDKIPARPITVRSADGQTIELRGGYTPVVYDIGVNQRTSQHEQAREAKDMMKAAYSSANVTKGFTKRRVEEVKGRPLSLSMRGFYNGVNDTIHYLAWQEWIVDANKLLKSNSIDTAIREHYGPEVKREFEKWRDDIVAGSRRLDHAIETAAGWARQSVSMSALTFNVMSAAMQPLGITQSIVRLGGPVEGTKWIAKGMGRYVASPIETTREANEKSAWMRNRSRTRFREINELRNQIQGQTAAKELMGRYGYWMMMRAQQLVDVPTWWGGYEKAIYNGHDEATAVALADQGVKDSQGGGEEVDQSGVERGGPLVKLFTAFYGFMGTALNTGYLSAKTERSKAKLAVNMLLLYSIPALFGALLKDALTPGDGDDDDLAKRLATEQITYLMGLIAFGREFSQAAKALMGEDKGMGYSGPAGLRMVPDAVKLAQQAKQGELDDGFRKAALNMLGDMTGIPSVQINRSITGIEALNEGKTENPAAVVMGYQEPH